MLTGRTRLATAALILIPALVYLGLEDDGQTLTTIEQPNPAHQQSDFYIINGNITDFTATGERKQNLLTKQLEHQPDLEQVLTIEPQLTLFSSDREPVTLSSVSGIISDNHDIVSLAGNVIFRDHPDENQANIMTTESLLIYPEKDFAETDKKVTLSNSTGVTTGVGMKSSFKSRTIELRSNVKGIHHANP